jgi:hypothetical protein
MKRFASSILALGSLLVACGGGTVTPSDGGTSNDGSTTNDGGTTNDGAVFGDAGSFCGAKKQRDEGCGTSFDSTTCLKLEACIGSVLRPEVATGYQTCIVTRACGVSDDTCIAAEEAKFLNDPATSQFRTSCFARRTACLEAGPAFADDNCATFGVFKDAFRASWADCLNKPCDQISACFGNLAKGQNCN